MKKLISKSGRMWIRIFLILYLASLTLFVFFPRPILESGDPAAIAEFIKSHTGFFYRILYANTQSVATANFVMLSPFVLLAALVFPEVKLSQITVVGIGISAFIEIFQTIIPGRVPDLTDLLANTVSVLIGAIFVVIVKKVSQLR